jgi:DNA-binding MarR family transcriptional regulator
MDNNETQLPIGMLLRNFLQVINARFATDSDNELSVTSFEILRVLEEKVTISQSEIVRITNIDRSTLSAVITRLIAAGMVHSLTDSTDLRRYILSITKKGEKLLLKGKHIQKTIDEEINACFKTSETKSAKNWLNAATRNIKK